MIQVGRNTSPFVRRMAISLRLLGGPHEHKALSTIAARAYGLPVVVEAKL